MEISDWRSWGMACSIWCYDGSGIMAEEMKASSAYEVSDAILLT